MIKHGVPALARDRLGHVDAHYLRTDTIKTANAVLTEAQARIPLANRRGGGHVASIAFIHTGAVRAHDVIRMRSRDRQPTPLGEAVAHYGRPHKTLHVLRLATTSKPRPPPGRPLRPGPAHLPRPARRPAPALLRRQEDQLGALGLLLNAIVLFTTRYLDAAITELRNDGYEVRDADAGRLSPSSDTTSHARPLFVPTPELAGDLPDRRQKGPVRLRTVTARVRSGVPDWPTRQRVGSPA